MSVTFSYAVTLPIPWEFNVSETNFAPRLFTHKRVRCFCPWKQHRTGSSHHNGIWGKPYNLRLPQSTMLCLHPKASILPLHLPSSFWCPENHWSGNPCALSIVQDPGALFIHWIQAASHTKEPVLFPLCSTQGPNSDARNLHWIVKPTNFFIVKSIINMFIFHMTKLLFIHQTEYSYNIFTHAVLSFISMSNML